MKARLRTKITKDGRTISLIWQRWRGRRRSYNGWRLIANEEAERLLETGRAVLERKR